MKEHKEREHAMLSASGSHRWIHCTPSVMLEEKYGTEGNTSYADEGTKAHELAELFIRQTILDEDINQDDIDAIMDSEYYSNEMLQAVEQYAATISEMFEQAKKSDPCAMLITEQKVDLRKWVPESFGTTDCTIIANGCMKVIDLKYGKGVRVDAENNSQLRLYALGSLEEHSLAYEIDRVQMVIIQPRIDHVSVEEMSVDDLYIWANTVVVPAADKAYAGEGDLASGEWCQFCKIKNQCRKLYEENIEKAKECFGSDPRIMNDSEIADVVIRGEEIMSWIKSVIEYAELQVINDGKTYPGTKLVRGRSVRKWVDEDLACDAILERFPELSYDQLTKTKIVGIGDVEKLVGKKSFNDKLSDLTIKPEGRLQLASLADKRPEASVSKDASEVFGN